MKQTNKSYHLAHQRDESLHFKEQNPIKIEQSKNKNEVLWIKTVKVKGLKETEDTLLKRRKQCGK